MAECFCGCGRRVKLIDRAINSQGKQITEYLEPLLQGELEIKSTGRGFGFGSVDEFVQEGIRLSARLKGAVHRELDPDPNDRRGSKHWFASRNAVTVGRPEAPVGVSAEPGSELAQPSGLPDAQLAMWKGYTERFWRDMVVDPVLPPELSYAMSLVLGAAQDPDAKELTRRAAVFGFAIFGVELQIGCEPSAFQRRYVAEIIPELLAEHDESVTTGLGSLQVVKALPDAFPLSATDWVRLEDWGCEKVSNGSTESLEATLRESLGFAIRMGYGMGLSASAIGTAQEVS